MARAQAAIVFRRGQALPRLYVERLGRPSGRALVFLHGLGGSAGLWAPVVAAVEPDWPGPVVLVDLPGHGASEPIADVGYEAMAAAVAQAVAPLDKAFVVGHSLGGVVALALTAPELEFPVSRVLAVSVRLRWSSDDLDNARRRAARQARHFPTKSEALAYALKVAGLPADIPAHDPRAARLVRSDGELGFRASFEPGASPAGRARKHPGTLTAELVQQSPVPVTLACGESDPWVRLSELRALDPGAVELPRSGHSPHLDNPIAMADLILRLTDIPPPRAGQRGARTTPGTTQSREQK
jgi:pimeloyl-ACP methyl ester carboxylesterase